MLIIGIESSCDETAVAVVEDGRRVLSSVIDSQTAVHRPFGGVVPEIAAREHLRVIGPLFRQALAESGISVSQVDAIALTQGPGLIGALLVGVAFAKGLAIASGLPLIPVDHVHAHVHGALLGVSVEPKLLYPTLALVISGGHTNLYRMVGPTAFDLLASTADDACGEAFDKVAKVLGLSYPGGPAIERLARQGRPGSVVVPRMVDQRTRLEFSYSGLKTFVANRVRALTATGSALSEQDAADLAMAFQEEALNQVVRKLSYATQRYPDTRSVVIAGGVAANSRLRELLAAAVALPVLCPAPSFCSDNAAMIAAYGYHLFQAAGQNPAAFSPHAPFDAYSRYDYLAVTATINPSTQG